MGKAGALTPRAGGRGVDATQVSPIGGGRGAVTETGNVDSALYNTLGYCTYE